jgi:hypothetical protein
MAVALVQKGAAIEVIRALVMAWEVRMLRSIRRDMKKNPDSEAVIEPVAIFCIKISLRLGHERGPMTF